jgi:threonine dehydrogenase-like Zn-dependent dehydrogenase
LRRLILDAPRELRLADGSEPPLGPGEVRVAPLAVGICGSDVHGYLGKNDRRRPGVVMGHEAAGRVIELGAETAGTGIGTVVAINPAVTCWTCEACLAGSDHFCAERRLYGCVPELPGAFAESIAIDARNAVAFSGPAPLEWAALAEPFAVADHGVGLHGEPEGRSLLVVGGGPIGIGAALGAQRRGAGEVVIAEPIGHRREVAAAVGLDARTPEAIAGMSRFDAAIDCAALPATLRLALDRTLPAAQTVIIGLAQPEIPLPVESVVVGERVLRGSFNYTRAEFAEVVEWIASGSVDLAPLIEARVALEQLPAAFYQYAEGASEAMKTMYVPEG